MVHSTDFGVRILSLNLGIKVIVYLSVPQFPYLKMEILIGSTSQGYFEN